ncbi:MAG: ATP-dependent DNA helicase RecG [Spirochaetaceae bacterium]|jgi:ATP-dependent DNA helicase RecG|nr:ATP-dependent DNA helicase RecG [Spirochaetaceae bacterium]
MYLRELTGGLKDLQGCGPKRLEQLGRLGITNIAELLGHYPRDYEDRSRTVPLNQWKRNGKNICTVVRVLSHEWFGFGRMKTLKVIVEDETMRASLACFGRPFLENTLRVGEEYRLWGSFFYKYGELQSSSFEFEPLHSLSGRSVFGKILPVYRLTEGLDQNILRKFIAQALEDYAGKLDEEVPERFRKAHGFMGKGEALSTVHFPASQGDLDKAVRSIKYEELFALEVVVAQRAIRRKGLTANHADHANGLIGLNEIDTENGLSTENKNVRVVRGLQQKLIERLPFKLTNSQMDAIAEINTDLSAPFPMARLLQGDVGSGKTLVAFLASLFIVDAGGQSAIMAPTELLARQHAETAAKLLEPLGLSIAFLSGNVKAAGRKELLKALAAGDIDIVVGTHALFSKDVVYKNLRLVVIDEQHRFGVAQRQAVMEKGNNPHLLMMSATPIPRSLAWTLYGDLEVTEIHEMPLGRKPIETHLAKMSRQQNVYDFVERNVLSKGHQAYFVYPLIEQQTDDEGGSKSSELKDVETMAKTLSEEIFPKYSLALIHSRLDEEQKRLTMEAFRKGEVQILVATSVVEVGVDVPNATCMVIEHAERFGLTALHQLRGRVGRGSEQSYCFLIYADQNEEDGMFAWKRPEDLSEDEQSKMGQRLRVMLNETNGFVIAEKDLKFRGPGLITGTEQSGFKRIGLADPYRDSDILKLARADAFSIEAQSTEAKELFLY